MSRQRIDTLLVALGLVESRAKAQAAIESGGVTADGRVIRKASEKIEEDAVLDVVPPHPWVSRGGVKLAAALDAFAIDPAGRACLDVGASTGGFTHVLLVRGAANITAVEGGHGQLHPTLHAEPRITSLEGCDIRTLDAATLPAKVSLIVIDVSFISLEQVIPSLMPFTSTECDLVALVKPQFEAGRKQIGKGGIVKDEAVQQAVCEKIVACAASHGWSVRGIISSPVTGGDGNREFLMHARK